MSERPRELNGIDLSKLREIEELIRKDPEKVRELSKWRARTMWLGGFRTKSYVRTHTVFVDEPVDPEDPGVAPNSVEYVISSLGACLATGFILNATRKGIRVHNMEIALEGSIDNILRFWGLSGEGHPGYKEISVKLYVRADADKEALSEIWRYTLETSPVGSTLVRNVAMKPEISVVE